MADLELCEMTPEHLRIREELMVLDLADQIAQKQFEEIAECIALADEVSKLKEVELAKLPFHLNLLATVADRGLKENAHSKLLWKLLQLPEILEDFMEYFFGKHFQAGDNKVNYPDRYRMDISIEGKTDFFIIENKINDAPEQCGQIYRYVSHALLKYRAENVHVLYLNSVTHELPSSYSLSEGGKGKRYIPEAVDKKAISYKEEIVEWLEKVYATVPEREHYLKSAIFQYLDYLKETYNINTRHKDMNKKIESLIKNRLFTEDMTTLEKMNAITAVDEQLDELKSYLVKLEAKQIPVIFQEWFDELTDEYPLDEYEWGRNDDTDIYLPFRYCGYQLQACLTFDDGLCWGIRCVNKDIPKKRYEELKQKVQVYLPRVQSSDMWPAWDYTSYENGLTRFKTLLECVFSIEDEE